MESSAYRSVGIAVNAFAAVLAVVVASIACKFLFLLGFNVS